uniref:C-type lectin domain-containing protein n=1 Tax=Oryzias melastigma TaxID=30732 RepID=A0A3B3CHA3_ORYME
GLWLLFLCFGFCYCVVALSLSCGFLFVAFTERNSSHAIYAKEERNWTDAQNFCRSYHTDLLSGAEQIKNLNGVKKEQLFPNGSKHDLVFFGLFRDAWQWSDGNNSSFRFWNLNYDDEKNVSSCVMLNEKGRWNSEKCTETHHFVCHDGKKSLKETVQRRFRLSCSL